MAIDPYAPCPAGTGKKLKFCCSDLIGELETIQRMLDGEQRLACLEHIDKLQTRFPGRACLLTTKAMLLSALGRRDEATQVVESVLAQSPANPVALGESALLTLGEGKVEQAVETLQQALAASTSPIPSIVVNVLASVAEMLLLTGHGAAALGHILLLLRYVPKDEHAMAMLVELNGSPRVPLLLKDDTELLPAPDGVPWRASFDAALEPARRGAWRLAADKLAALAQTATDARAVWHNLARLRMWIADDKGAVAALRRLAALDLRDDAKVEAEALAQVLDADAGDPRVDIVAITYPVTDAEQLAEKLTDRRVVRMPAPPDETGDANDLPPRHVFMLLDRPAPRTGVGLAREAVPNVLGQLFVFGRQTDREARLEVELDRPNLPAVQAALSELCGPLLGSPEPEVIRGAIPVSQRALSWAWRLPEDTPVDEVHRLLVEQRRYAVLKEWTNTPLAVLEGQTPRAAAAGERLRIRLLAAILALELAFQEPSASGVFHELRGELGLPQPPEIDPTGLDVNLVPLARLHRLDLGKLDDSSLVLVYRRAVLTRARAAARKCALAMVSRESLKPKLSVAQLYGMLADMEDDTSQAIKYVNLARQAAEAAGESTANWDLQELALRLDRGEPSEFGQLLAHIQMEHIREPGVARALTQLLVEAGLITPDGRPAVPLESAAAAAQGAAPEPGKIWTPESETPGKKSALWIPGTD
ncbi:MAG: hypothetical protein HYX69_05335 [Planctomycetia bacterium]|nr:hypothetical protein [Planctomycetia bacterium]